MDLTFMERCDTILYMENKQSTSLKVWKQTQEKLKILAAFKRKTMLEILEEIVDKELKKAVKSSEDH
jgi:hypothetical protein